MALEILATAKSLIEVIYSASDQCEYFLPVHPLNSSSRRGALDKYGINGHYYGKNGDGRGGSGHYVKNPDPTVLYLNCDFSPTEDTGPAVSFLRIKRPSEGSFFEEQEISVFVTECPCDEPRLSFLDLNSSLPTPPLDPVYSELTNYEHGSNTNYDDAHILYDSNDPASMSHPNPCSNQALSQRIYGSSSFSGLRTLPPPPVKTGKNENFEMTNKFSSIAKTAGRKLAKKILSMRHVSRTNFDTARNSERSRANAKELCARAAMPVPGLIRENPPNSANKITTTNNSDHSSQQGQGQGSSSNKTVRRSIPRPSIPPPEPPPIPESHNQNFNYYDATATATTITDKKFEAPNFQSLNSSNDDELSEFRSSTNNRFPDHREEFDDYEDSDFYDSDSDLIRNFVSAVQPLYSTDEEPLYQYYTYGISLQPEDDYQPVIPKNLGLTIDMLVPRVGQRTLWCELPEVKSSGILGILSDKQKQLQEAIFEILTSEVSYLKSLDVLILLFKQSYELTSVLSVEESQCVWGNIIQVKKCSQSFHAALLAKWEESWYIQEIGEMLNSFACNQFKVYKEYCRNKPHQDRTMQKLRMMNDEFVNVVKMIEENPKCQMLRMDSFLMLPMQRITRLPLLVNAVIQRTQSLKEKAYCEEALKNLTNLVLECNEAARDSQDEEDTAAIIKKIDFPRGLQHTSLGKFILKGEFMKNPFDNNPSKGSNQINWTFRKTKRTCYCLILFSDKLLVTKKKSSGRFEIIDCADTSDSNIKPMPQVDAVSSGDFQFFFMLHFIRKEAIYFLGARTESELERWRHKLETLKIAEDEKVEAIFHYNAQREDEMTFEAGDIIRVLQKQADGWFFGVKTSNDNESGWFPGNYCCEC